jgi:hypothetical protein
MASTALKMRFVRASRSSAASPVCAGFPSLRSDLDRRAAAQIWFFQRGCVRKIACSTSPFSDRLVRARPLLRWTAEFLQRRPIIAASFAAVTTDCSSLFVLLPSDGSGSAKQQFH